MKVLIAEDDRASCRLLATLLNKRGYQVLEASNGTEAWEVYQQEDPFVVITDWIMGEVDGPELCRLIRAHKRWKYTYIILVTVLTGKGSYMEGMAAGADDFLHKPYDPDLLVARLKVAERILNLQDEVKRLQGLLPICQYCKKIREDKNLWTQIESYIAERSEADFTHGICPECYEKHVRPELEHLKASYSVPVLKFP